MKQNKSLCVCLIMFIALSNFNNKTIAQVDTTILYLEDTSYYYHMGPLEFLESMKKDSNSVRFYMNSTSVYYFLKDSLPNSYYQLYELHKKDSTIKNKKDFLVVEGRFKDSLREGLFKYRDGGSDGTALKIVPFKKGIVDGKVLEISHDRINFITEYKNGIADGLYFYRKVGFPFIKVGYYKDGILLDMDTLKW